MTAFGLSGVHAVIDFLQCRPIYPSMAHSYPEPAVVSEIIEMALSDHVSFDQIRALHGLGPDEVKALMLQSLKPGSYRAWRKRVRTFSDRRAVYK